MRRLPAGLVLLALSACGGGEMVGDGGRDAGSLDGWSITPPEAPAIDWLAAGRPAIAPPAAPTWACPTGWRAIVSAEGDPGCEAWPETGAPECDATSMAIPGATCAPVGSACPADGWPASLPASGVRYVRAGAAGGDGSRAAPFGTIAQALSGIAPGTTIALASGEHAGPAALPAGVALVGACAGGTTLRATTADEAVGVIDVTGADVVVRDLALTGPRPGITLSGAARAITVEDVIVHDVVRDGILVVGTSSVTATDLLVRDVASSPSTGRAGRAIDVQEGGTVEVARLEARRVHNAGVVAWDPGTHVTLSDAWIHDVLGDHDTGPYGFGLDAEPGGALEASRVVIEDVRANGIVSQGTGASVIVHDAIVRDVAPNADDTLGGGAAANGGARLELHGASIDRTTQHGVSASDSGTAVVLEDVIVRDVGGRPSDGLYGTGIEVDVAASVTATRVVVRRASGAALFAGRGGALHGTDVTVDDTRPSAADGFAPAVHVLGGTVELERAVLGHSLGLGVFGTEEPTIALTDVVVGVTAIVVVGVDEIAMGVLADGGTLTLTRVEVRESRDGIAIRGASFEIADAVVAQLEVEGATEPGGGFTIAEGAQGSIERFVVDGADGWGGFVFGADSVVTLRDIVVRDVRVHPELGTSYSVAFAEGAHVTMERAALETAESEALVVAGAFLDVTDLRVRQVGTGDPSALYAPSAIATKVAHVRAERVEIETARGLGIRVEGALGTDPSTFTDLVIHEVAQRECGDACPMGAGGNAFTAAPAANVTLDRFEVRGAALCGLQIFSPEVSASRGRVADSTIGVNLQVAGFDTARLAGVELSGNAVDLDARELPIPGTSPAPVEPTPPAPGDPTGGGG